MNLKIILAAGLIFLLFQQAYGQQNDDPNLKPGNAYDQFDFCFDNQSIEDSIYYFFSAYYKVHVDLGLSRENDLKISEFSGRFFTNISYSYSSFIMPLGVSPTQVGFYNELGFYNIYLKVGLDFNLFYSL